MRHKSSFLAGLMTATALMMAPLAVSAFTIDSSTQVNDTFDVSWELMGTDSTNPVGEDLSGVATFEYLGLSVDGTSVQFGLTLTNTTAPSATTSAVALRAFGFGTDANFALASWGSSASGGTDKISDNGSGSGISRVVKVDPNNPPSGTPNLNTPVNGDAPVECLKDPNNTVPEECVTLLAVADGDGLGAGATDSFEFTLGLDRAVSLGPLTIDPFAVAYDFDQDSTKPPVQVRIAAQVPLPGTLALVGAGILLMRRKARRQSRHRC